MSNTEILLNTTSSAVSVLTAYISRRSDIVLKEVLQLNVRSYPQSHLFAYTRHEVSRYLVSSMQVILE